MRTAGHDHTCLPSELRGSGAAGRLMSLGFGVSLLHCYMSGIFSSSFSFSDLESHTKVSICQFPCQLS